MKLYNVKIQIRILFRKFKYIKIIVERFYNGFNKQCFPVNVNFGSQCQTWQQIDHQGSKSFKSRNQIIVSSKSAKLTWVV